MSSMTAAATTPTPTKPDRRVDPDQERGGAAGGADVGERLPGERLPADAP